MYLYPIKASYEAHLQNEYVIQLRTLNTPVYALPREASFLEDLVSIFLNDWTFNNKFHH